MTAFLWSVLCIVVFFVKQKTAYEMRISDWSSDVCSSDLLILIFSELVRWGFGDRPLYLDIPAALGGAVPLPGGGGYPAYRLAIIAVGLVTAVGLYLLIAKRLEEYTSELQSLMRYSYDVFCLKKKHKLSPTLSLPTHP